jgi:hypothetical protein
MMNDEERPRMKVCGRFVFQIGFAQLRRQTACGFARR